MSVPDDEFQKKSEELRKKQEEREAGMSEEQKRGWGIFKPTAAEQQKSDEKDNPSK